ncbi:MAG: hypothetical protein QM778_11615 [Myxococcales bacterium]
MHSPGFSRFLTVSLLVLASLLGGTARAQDLRKPVPKPLEPWVPWVLDDLGEQQCPQIDDLRVCVWTTRVTLDATDAGASFTLAMTVDRKGYVELPGSRERWPEDVRVDGQPRATLQSSDGTRPIVELSPGTHSISGRFVWSSLPDSLQMPADLGSLALRVKGTPIAFPKREKDGLVWLGGGGNDAAEEERLELSVHRMIEDGVPLVLHTRVRVSAGGKAREIVLPNVLVAGTRPVELSANLPAQLSPEGALRIQAQAGDYQVEIRAVVPSPLEVLSAPNAAAPWPDHEIWVFRADDRLRHVELSGAPQVDAARTDLAPDWAHLPAYSVGPGVGLRIETKRRGEPEPAPNQIHLSRALWLDLDGEGYTVRDHMSGAMNRDFRVDLTRGNLGHAFVDGADQVITVHDKKSGVEIRQGNFDLKAEWRMDQGRNELAAVGYEQDVHQLSTELNLPPGFKLLGSSGVDNLPGTWLDEWDLFDFFFVLLLSLAVAKIAGRFFFPLAIVTLVLTHSEPEAPALAWIFLVASAALTRVVREGRWGKIVRGTFIASAVGILLVMVPFAVSEVRQALYPQLEFPYTGPSSYSTPVFSENAPAAPSGAESAPMAEPAPMPEAPAQMEGGGGLQDVQKDEAQEERSELKTRGRLGSSYGSGYGKAAGAARQLKQEIDPNQVVQTGPGVPVWRFRTYNLSWSGPVEHSQRLSLWILPPALTRIWSLLSVLLSAALLFVLLRAARSAGAGTSAGGGLAASVLALLGVLAVQPAQAQDFPSAELLNQLRERLTEPAECEPNCLAVSTLKLKVEAGRLTLRVQVNAGAAAIYQAPGPLESWSPEQVKVDGKEALAMVRLDDGFLHVRVAPGLHEVEFTGPLPRSQALTLALGTPPHRVETEARGYVIDGVNQDGHAEGSISIRRELAEDAQDEEGSSQALEPWLSVRREFELGIRFRVRTVIQRVSAPGASVLVRLPLLPGESVTESGLVSEQGSVSIELPRDQSQVTFSSTLAPTSELKLQAATPNGTPKGAVVRPWNETWVIRPSALYHVSFDGIAPITRKGPDGVFEPEYRPWPGETLSVKAEKLAAAEGTSVTIDSTRLELHPGSRMEQSTLTLQVRSSHGTSERIRIPAQAILTGCTVDGEARSTRVKDGAIELQLNPGQHSVVLTLQRPVGMDNSYSPGSVSLTRPLTNITTSVNIPGDRWLLWASGPSWGPAVLFWGYLVVVVLAALGLGRVPFSPLKTHEWVLLGLGLTQVDVGVVFIVLAWLFCLAFRERNPPREPLLFNANQVFLGVLTVVALCCLAFAVHQGLVVQPDMQVQGQDSTNELLNWYTDRSAGTLPEVRIWSVPLWIYKGLMLLWALWLAASVLRWLRWGWSAFRQGGGWQAGAGGPHVFKRNPEAPEPSPPPAPTAGTSGGTPVTSPAPEAPAAPLDVQRVPGQNPRVPLDQIERAQAELDRARKRERDPESGEDA